MFGNRCGPEEALEQHGMVIPDAKRILRFILFLEMFCVASLIFLDTTSRIYKFLFPCEKRMTG